jgi:hypothetical protein
MMLTLPCGPFLKTEIFSGLLRLLQWRLLLLKLQQRYFLTLLLGL